MFLDFDPQDGIAAGREWEQELYRQLRDCQAVLVLCSESSMASPWCFAEIAYAKALGKNLFPAKIGACAINPILTSRQLLDFTGELAHPAYERLLRGLKKAGLDPANEFEWEDGRSPYPGLFAFNEADAAFFFGRDSEIQQGLELLNRNQQFGNSQRALILGASGSGKSSLLRAGLLPRLRRNEEHWIVIDCFRPRQDPLYELAVVLSAALANAGQPQSAESIRQKLEHGGAAALTKIADDLRLMPGRREAKVLIPIDQMEELLGPAPPASSAAFLALIRAATGGHNTPVMMIGTLRSDFLGEFQNHPAMRDARFETLPVGPMTRDSLEKIISEPARKVGGEVQPDVVQALIAETEKENALPLLAFTLSELWKSGRKQIKLEDYKSLGGIAGSVARVANAVYNGSNLSPEQKTDLRRAFLMMVRVNENGQFARHVVRKDKMPASVKPVLDDFVNARLLVTNGEGAGQTIEVAHEAIFRSWDVLKTWLTEDREFLLWQRRLEDRLRSDSSPLTGPGLAEARRWFTQERARLGDEESSFIAASIKAADRQRTQRIVILTAVIALLAMAAGYSMIKQRQAEQQRQIADQQRQQRLDDNVNVAWTAITTKQCTDLVTGVRVTYCSVAPYLGIDRLKALSGLSVFQDGGPHDKTLAFNSEKFGHYNIKFVKWAKENLLPKEVNSQEAAKLAYRQIGQRTARVFLLAHQWLEEHPAERAKLVTAYRDGVRVKLEGKDLQHLSPYWKYGEQLDNDRDVAFRNGTNGQLACTAIGFWARREVDGTAEEFYDGLRRTLQMFDPEFLKRRG